MSKNLNNAELIQKLETAEKRIIQLEGDLARKARRLDEYEQAEHECREREQKLSQLLEILPVGISILDSEDNIVYSNPALQKILQINQEGLLNGTYRDRRYVAADGAAMPPDAFANRQAKQRGEPVYDVETGIVKEDGMIIWTNVSAMPVDFSDWKTVVTTIDITTRKNAEDEQRKSQDRLSKIFQTSPVPMVIGDVETSQFIEVNQAYERLVEYDRDEILGHTPFELDIYADKEQLIRARHAIQTQGGLHSAELTLRTKSNELRNVLAWSQVLRFSNGQMINLGTALDVTGHRLAEKSLRESEARYRSLFENSPVAIWEEDFSTVKAYLDDLKHQGVTDLDAYLTAHQEVIQECLERIQIIDVNQASVNLYEAASKAELLGSLRHAFPSEALAGFKNELLKVARGELDFHGESFVQTVDGELRNVIVDWVVSPGHEQTYAKVLVIISDITDLRHAQKKYQEIFEHSAEGIFQTTPDGRFLNANPALARIYGYDSPQELIETLTDISNQLYLKPAEREEFIRLLESKGAIESFETTDRRKDGTIIWTSTSARVVRDANGRTLYYEGSLQDITERKQAQQAVADSEKRFRAMIENGLDDISLLDVAGNLLWERPAVVRNLGYAPDEHLGHNIFDLIHPADRGWTNELFTKLIHEPGSRQHGTFRLQHANGSWRWVEAVAANLLDEPSVAGVVVNYRDITERKQAEEAQHEAELRYRALFEQSHDAIFILDLQGRHLAFNQRAVDMLGYSRQELLGLSTTDISAEKVQSQQVLQELLNGQHIPIYERLFRKKDGSTFPVEINAELVRDMYGNALHIQSVVREISDRRRAETQLQQRNEDLGLINTINEIIVQGGNLETVVSVLAKEMKRIFSSQGTSLYMLSPDGQSLTMQQYAMPTELTRKIEQLIGSTIPIVKIPIQEGGLFERVLHSGRGIIVSDPKELQHWLTGFAETEFLPSIARSAIRKLLPRIQKLLNIKSTIIIPLRSHENTIGLLNVSSAGLFASEDLKRIESIGRQLTAAIQHQQANEKIQRSEGFLNSIQNALSASIAILDETGTIVQVNSAWRKFGEQNGLTDPRSCIGRNYLAICDSASGANAEEARAVAGAIREVIAGKRREAWLEYPCHSPEEKRWFLLRITKFEDGDKIWVVLAHENITERRQAQDVIQRSAALLAQAGKMAHLGAWEIAVSNPENLNENPSQWSDEVYRIFGYEPGKVLAGVDLFYERVHPDDRQKVQNAMSRAIVEKKPYEVEHRIIRLDGVERIVEERADLIFDQQGRLIQILGAIQDITEHKRTEQALRETSEQFRALFEASPEAIMLIDPHGDWPILDCNASACSMNGYERQELIGQTIDILTLSRGDAAGRLEYLESVRSAGILRYEDFHRHKDGSIFPIEVSTSLHTLGGREVVLGIDRDITERKKAETALRESEEKYRLLFEANPLPMWIYDLETLRFLKVNTAAINHYGYAEVEFMSMTIKDIRPPQDVPRLLENIAQARDGMDNAGVWTHIKKDGSPIRVEIMSDEVEFDGRQTKLVLVNDITERIRAEEALHESEQKYRNLVETSHDLIWAVDGDGSFTYLNQASKEIYGYEPEELLGHSFLEILDPGYYTLDWDTFKKNIADGDKFVDVESVVRHRDGRQIILSANSLVLRDGNNNLIGVVGSSRDITERKRAEEALRESEERFSNAFEFAPIGMALVALDGRWLKVNQAICELVGYTQEELQAMTFQQVTHPDDLEADLNQVKQLLAGAVDSYQMEKRYIHKSGRLVWVLLGASLIKDMQGRPTYFISQIQDITERKQAERVIQQRNEDLSLLDAVNEALNRNESLSAVMALVSESLKQIFKGYGATIYLLDADRQKLINQNLALPPDMVRKIEKLVGFAIPRLQFDLQRTHPFRGVFETKTTQVMNDPQSVQQHYLAFAEAVPLNPTLRAVARKIMPLVQKLVDVQAELLVPLISKEEIIGVIDLGGNLSFTEENVQRVESIASQLTAAIQRKQAEEALHHSEEQYRSLFEDSPVALWLEDFSRVKQLLNQLKQEGVRDIRAYLHGHPEFVRECLDCVSILDVNNAATKLFHAKHKNELLGSLSAAVPYILPEQFETELLQIAEGRISFEWDEDGYTTTGQKISLHLRWSVVPGYEGDLAKVIVSMVDITERKQAEESLRRSETRYRLATQATNDVIWEWDAIAHQLIWSENAQFVFGYPAEEIGPQEKWWDQHIHPDDLERILSKLDDFMSSPGSIWAEEYRFLRKDGSYAHVSDRAYMERDTQGNPLRLIGAMSDITERKKNEAETRRRADEFAVLYETARDLATQYNLPTLLNTIVERARAMLRTGGGGIYLFDETYNNLEMVLAVGSPIPIGTRVQMGEGMAGQVAQTQHRLIVDDYHTWAGRSRQITFESVPFRAVLEVPMLYGGQLIGVLVVHELGESERKYSEADAHLLSLFAEYAASAVHAARLLQQTTRRAEETAALLETSLALTSLDLDSTLQTFGERAQKLFEADSCRIFLMEPDGETLRCVLALQETSDAFSHLRIKLGVGVTGAVAASGRAEIVNEMQNDPRALQIANTPDEEEAIMFAPLKERDRTIGVLSVRRLGTQRPFQPADLALLEALASMSASAVSNARLFEQTEQRLNELQALYENGLAVGRLLEPQAIGERIIQTVSQYLSWHHVTIRLCKENSDEMELVAFHLPHMAEEKTTEDEHRFKFHVSRVGQGLSGWVVQTGSPIRTSNLSADPHYVNTYEGMQSGLYMPLNVGDRVMGVISVESEQPDAFSEQDERLLATLANQAATAFENARLYQSAQQEISERRIAEEALRQSEENYRRLARELEDRVHERTAEVQDLYDNAPCGYLSLDADGNIARINQTELDWLGYTREEILGHPFTDFVTHESHNIFKETFPAFKLQGSIRDLELEMQRKDGSILPILVSATAVYDQDGKYFTSRSTLSDDTSRKHAMETLRLANAEMKRAMRMKDEFLANMSHELRTPLNAILGLSESLLEQTAGPINERQQKYLGTVNESGRHLLELINDILDLAKIESGQIKIDPGRVNINTVCETSLRMIKQLAQKKNQTVEVEIEKEIGYVWADERRLKQMMVNLLSNAVKFTPVDGQLGLKASIDRHDMKLLITIWDHGIGIREQDLSRLFRPFVQLDSSLARESSGTGLGLALVAEMARLHGGSVSVASQPGKGSEFTISLPWDPAITTDTLDKLRISGKIPLMKRTSTEKQTILLVEDTDSVVLMLRDYLELSGYKVEIARDGLEGLSKAISVRPDLILMDVQMPGLDGLEATRRLRRDDSLKNTPVIALTALAMPSDRTRCLEAGMDDYLSKPINLKELAKAVLRNLPDSGTGKKS